MNSFPDTRQSLLLRVKGADNATAWGEFAQIYRPIIFRIAVARGLQEADAQDLAQQVLMSVYAAIDRWEPHGPDSRFRNWLSKITRNAILKTFSRTPLDAAAGGSQHSLQLNACSSPESQQLEWLLEEEYRRELYLRAAERVKQEVNSKSWQVFLWTTLQDVSIEEAAEKLNQSVGSIYAMRSRVMRRLRDTVRELRELEQ